MELKIIRTVDSDYSHLQDNKSRTKSPPSAPTAVAVLEVEASVEDNDGVSEKISDGMKTPTSPLNIIQPILRCPLAPRKPKAAPLRKRKLGSHREMRLLDLSNEVLSLYPPALVKDFGNKIKKAKRVHQHDQLKENICSYVNHHTAMQESKHMNELRSD